MLKERVLQEFNNILLFGGETKNENMPVGFYSSLAMLPLRGKPVIWWQLDNLRNKGINNFIIAVCSNNTKLINYIKNYLSQTFDIKLVLVNSKKNILSSMKYSLQKADINLPTRIILGDTLIPDSIDEQTDILYTSKAVSTSENWCLAETDKSNNIICYYDKEKNINLENKEALVGYYTFSDTKYLLNCCIKARLMLKKEISTALIMYQQKYNLKARLIDDWYDLGHTSGLIKAKNILFNARSFNSISVDTSMGTLCKTSTKIQKLEDEAFWYDNLPENLKILAPRLINFSKDNKTAALTQELYGYPSLQELYISGEVNIEDWNYILERLFELHKKLEKYKIPYEKKPLKWLYLDKTRERVQELKQNSYWKDLLKQEFVFINGNKYRGIQSLLPQIECFINDNLLKQRELTIIHGDYCFSNILFDSSNYVFKLIDPRGRLNAEATIYGDSKYDIAKLRHSVCGLYDFIVHGMYNLTDSGNIFELNILTSTDYSALETIFDNLCIKNGFEPDEIKFIEGLLFLSMIPLHGDDFNRQKAFFVKSIELLNKVLNKDS